MKNKTNIFEKVGNILLFKGNLNRLPFLILIALAMWLYCCYLDLTIAYKLHGGYYTTFMEWFAWCYVWGILITGRLKNLKINPSIAYFFVVALWITHYVALRYGMPPIFSRVKQISMLEILILLPLFAKDKKTLQFWKSE